MWCEVGVSFVLLHTWLSCLSSLPLLLRSLWFLLSCLGTFVAQQLIVLVNVFLDLSSVPLIPVLILTPVAHRPDDCGSAVMVQRLDDWHL